MDLSDKLKNLLISFNKALKQLNKCLELPKDEFIRDSAIQRFEFTYELFWKTVRVYCLMLGIEANSPRASFKEGFKVGIIEDDKTFMSMLRARNLTVHSYDESLAEEIYSELDLFAKTMKKTAENIRKDFVSDFFNEV